MNRTFKEVPSFTEKWIELGFDGRRKKNAKEIGCSSEGGVVMGLYEELEKSLLEAIEIEKGNVPLVEKNAMPAKTFYVSDKENALIEEFVLLRKKEKVSQKEIADRLGSKQQAISRVENCQHSPSLKLFNSMVDVLGYELKIVKKENG